jgi:hypothetical protein
MKEPATNEQPPSVATLLSEILGSCGKAGMCRFPPCSCAESIDALIAQRVSAETERCAQINRQRLEQIGQLQETVQSFQSARDERPASTGEQSDEWVLVPRSPTTEMLKAAYDDARADDNPLNALDCWDSTLPAQEQ